MVSDALKRTYKLKPEKNMVFKCNLKPGQKVWLLDTFSTDIHKNDKNLPIGQPNLLSPFQSRIHPVFGSTV